MLFIFLVTRKRGNRKTRNINSEADCKNFQRLGKREILVKLFFVESSGNILL